MAEVKWIKITTDMFDNKKIKLIESLPESDSILVIWVKLLSLAGQTNESGYLYFTEGIPYTDEMLATIFRRPLNIVRLALETFSRFKMITLHNQVICISNWEKYQNTEGMDKLREYNRIAKRNERERKKQYLLEAGNVNDTSMTVKECQGADIDKELDIDKEIDKIIIMSAEEESIITILKSIKDYPLSLEKDLLMINNLKERYPTLNLLESIKDFAILKVDKPLKPKENPRSQINTSCKKHVEWKRNLKGKEVVPGKATGTDYNSLMY